MLEARYYAKELEAKPRADGAPGIESTEMRFVEVDGRSAAYKRFGIYEKARGTAQARAAMLWFLVYGWTTASDPCVHEGYSAIEVTLVDAHEQWGVAEAIWAKERTRENVDFMDALAYKAGKP